MNIYKQEIVERRQLGLAAGLLTLLSVFLLTLLGCHPKPKSTPVASSATGVDSTRPILVQRVDSAGKVSIQAHSQSSKAVTDYEKAAADYDATGVITGLP